MQHYDMRMYSCREITYLRCRDALLVQAVSRPQAAPYVLYSALSLRIYSVSILPRYSAAAALIPYLQSAAPPGIQLWPQHTESMTRTYGTMNRNHHLNGTSHSSSCTMASCKSIDAHVHQVWLGRAFRPLEQIIKQTTRKKK